MNLLPDLKLRVLVPAVSFLLLASLSCPSFGSLGPSDRLPEEIEDLDRVCQRLLEEGRSLEDPVFYTYGKPLLPRHFDVTELGDDEHPSFELWGKEPVESLANEVSTLQRGINSLGQQELLNLARIYKLPTDTEKWESLKQQVLFIKVKEILNRNLAYYRFEKGSFEEYLVEYGVKVRKLPRALASWIVARSLRWSTIPGGIYRFGDPDGESRKEIPLSYVQLDEFEITSIPVTQGLAYLLLGSPHLRSSKTPFSGWFSPHTHDGHWLRLKAEMGVHLFHPASFTPMKAQTLLRVLEGHLATWDVRRGSRGSRGSKGGSNLHGSSYQYSIGSAYQVVVALKGVPPLPPVVGAGEGHGHDHGTADTAAYEATWKQFASWLMAINPRGNAQLATTIRRGFDAYRDFSMEPPVVPTPYGSGRTDKGMNELPEEEALLRRRFLGTDIEITLVPGEQGDGLYPSLDFWRRASERTMPNFFGVQGLGLSTMVSEWHSVFSLSVTKQADAKALGMPTLSDDIGEMEQSRWGDPFIPSSLFQNGDALFSLAVPSHANVFHITLVTPRLNRYSRSILLGSPRPLSDSMEELVIEGWTLSETPPDSSRETSPTIRLVRRRVDQ